MKLIDNLLSDLIGLMLVLGPNRSNLEFGLNQSRNCLIAVGALAPAFGGAGSRMGIPAALYIGELLGAVLMFIGFWRATTPMGVQQLEATPQPVTGD